MEKSNSEANLNSGPGSGSNGTLNDQPITAFDLYKMSLNLHFGPETHRLNQELADVESRKIAHYVQLDYKRASDPKYLQCVSDLLTKPVFWGMRKPKLFIEITGSKRNYSYVNKRARLSFNRGLVSAAKSADAWIITDGLNRGVTKLIGESFHQSRLVEGEAAPLCVAIGRLDDISISQRRLINKAFDRQISLQSALSLKLKKSKNSKNVVIDMAEKSALVKNVQVDDYYSYRRTSLAAPAMAFDASADALEQSHSHFIMIDGSRNQVETLKTKLLNKLAKPTGKQQRNIVGQFKTPILMIVIGGDWDTLKKIAMSLLIPYETVNTFDDNVFTQPKPIVLLKGFHGVADLLSYAFEITDASESEASEEKIIWSIAGALFDSVAANTAVSERVVSALNSILPSSERIPTPETLSNDINDYETDETSFDGESTDDDDLGSRPRRKKRPKPFFPPDSGNQGWQIPTDFDDRIKQRLEFQNLIRMVPAERQEESVVKLIEFIRKFVQNRKYVSVIDISLDKNISPVPLHSQLLSVIFKAAPYEPSDMFELARQWSRVDFAENLLQRKMQDIGKALWQPVRINTRELIKRRRDKLVLDAIINGQGDFCKLMDDFDLVTIKSFVTRTTMSDIYRQVFIENLPTSKMAVIRFVRDFLDCTDCYYLEDGTFDSDSWLKAISRFLSSAIGCYINNTFTEPMQILDYHNEPDFEPDLSQPHLCAMRDLFLYALLMDADDLALLAWHDGHDQIGTALIGANFLKNLATKAESKRFVDLAYRYRQNAEKWKSRAAEVLATCSAEHPKRASTLLTRCLATWQGYTVLDIAYHADHKEFMSEPSVQRRLRNLWNSPTYFDESPPDPDFRPSAKPNCALIRKLKTPKIKCLIHYLHTIIALFLFSYLVIVDPELETNVPKVLTSYLFLWTSSTFFENVVLLWQDPLYTKTGEKIRRLISNGWNWVDFCFVFLVFVITMKSGSIASEKSANVRNLFGMVCLIYWLKAFHILLIFEPFGSKVITLMQMFWDVTCILVIYLIMLVAFAVPLQVVMYPGEKIESPVDIFLLMISRWWYIVGVGLNDARREAHGTCEEFKNSTPPMIRTHGHFHDTSHCSASNPLSIILIGIYLLVTNIMLLNIMTAMLSHTAKVVLDQSRHIWHFHLFQVVNEFHNKPVAPPPFNFPYHIWRLFISHCRRGGITENTRLKQYYQFYEPEYLGMSYFERDATFELHCRILNEKHLEAQDD